MGKTLELPLPDLSDGQVTVYTSNAKLRILLCGPRWGKSHIMQSTIT